MALILLPEKIIWKKGSRLLSECSPFGLSTNRLFFYSDYGMLVQYKRIFTDLEEMEAANKQEVKYHRMFKVDYSNIRPRYSEKGDFVTFSQSTDGTPDEAEEIYSFDLKNRGAVRYTSQPANDWNPIWSKDGRYFYFCSNRSGVYDIYRTVATRKDITYYNEGDEVDTDKHPDLPEDVDVMKLLAARSIREVNAFYTKTTVTSKGNDFYPVLSPDGNTLAFLSDRSGEVKIRLLDLAANEETLVMKNSRGSGEIYWKKDSRLLLYTSKIDQGREIFCYDIESKKIQQITDTPEDESNPVFMGDDIVFTRATLDGASSDIWLRDSKSGQEQRLTPSYSLDFGAWPNPDGEHMAFVSNRSGSNNIWMMNKAGQKVVQLTNFSSGDYAWGPDWSPDGKNIAFYYMGGGVRNLGTFDIIPNMVQGLFFRAREAVYDHNYKRIRRNIP